MQAETADLETTMQVLQGDVSALRPAQALGQIEGWKQALLSAGKSELVTIAGDLGELQQLLTSGSLNGPLIGALLQRLGSQTSGVASQAPVQDTARLQELAALLIKAGRALS